MELLLKDHVMREIQEDRETSLRCYEDKPTRDIVNFLLSMFEKRSNEVLVTVEYPDGTRITEATYTIDGKWKMIAKVLGGIVIAWKPFPEPYKEN